jgi:endonuclease YncB( thermonuclease family)
LPVWSRTWLGAATILLLSAPAGTATQASATVSGTADIIDGDTLDVGTARVRLFGIDAPEPRKNAQTVATRNGPVDAPQNGRRRN